MKIKNNDQGGTFMLVIIGFAVLFMISMVAIFITISNTKQTVIEENRTQSYYLAQTGAQAFVDHIQSIQKKPIDGVSGIQKLENLSKIKQSERNTYEEVDGYFVIKVKSKGEDKYEVITTATVGDSESTLVAVINGINSEHNKDDSNNIGQPNSDGHIFLNLKKKIEIPKLIQTPDNGVSIYTAAKKDIEQSPIFIKDEKVKSLFLSLNDREVGNIVKDLNAQQYNGYRLEITNPRAINSVISEKTPIKAERLIKNKKDDKFHEILFRYGMNKQELLNFFSKGKLKEKDMSDDEIKSGLKNVFLLPINTVKEYKDYISGTDLYPRVSIHKPSEKHYVVTGLDTGKPLSSERTINIPKGKDATFEGGIHTKEGGKLTILTEGDCDILLKERFHTSNGKKQEVIIKSDGKVNIYMAKDKDIQLEGNVKAEGNGEVNIYMTNSTFQIEDGATIENINLYAPYTDVQIKDGATYQGIIVAGPFQMNDNSIFKAPIHGPASTIPSNAVEDDTWKENDEVKDNNKGLEINWQNTTEVK